MKDTLDELADEYRHQLEADGWKITIQRNQPRPDRKVPYHHLIFDHVLSGRKQYSFIADRSKDEIRKQVDDDLGPELELVREAPPMRNPARIAFIRAHFSGYGWDEQTRTQAATLLALIRTITRPQAEWLVRAGVPIGGRGRPTRSD